MKSILSKAFNLTLFFAFLYFAFNFLNTNIQWDKVKLRDIDLVFLLVSAICLFFYQLIYGAIWSGIINQRLPQKKAPVENISIWFTSLAGKYLPLKLASMGYKALQYIKGGLKLKVAQAIYDENLISLLSGFIVTSSLLFTTHMEDINNYYISFIGLSFFIFLSTSKVQQIALTVFSKISKRKFEYHQMGRKYFFIFLIGYLFTWLIYGFSNFLVIKSIVPSFSFSNLFYIIWLSAASGLFGMFAFFAPSGLGAREGLFILGLAKLLPMEKSLFAAILCRVLITIIELISVALGLLLRKFYAKV